MRLLYAADHSIALNPPETFPQRLSLFSATMGRSRRRVAVGLLPLLLVTGALVRGSN